MLKTKNFKNILAVATIWASSLGVVAPAQAMDDAGTSYANQTLRRVHLRPDGKREWRRHENARPNTPRSGCFGDDCTMQESPEKPDADTADIFFPDDNEALKTTTAATLTHMTTHNHTAANAAGPSRTTGSGHKKQKSISSLSSDEEASHCSPPRRTGIFPARKNPHAKPEYDFGKDYPTKKRKQLKAINSDDLDKLSGELEQNNQEIMWLEQLKEQRRLTALEIARLKDLKEIPGKDIGLLFPGDMQE